MPSNLARIHHVASITTAPSAPRPSAVDVTARLDGSSRNFSRASGMLKIATYATPQAATIAIRHHW